MVKESDCRWVLALAFGSCLAACRQHVVCFRHCERAHLCPDLSLHLFERHQPQRGVQPMGLDSTLGVLGVHGRLFQRFLPRSLFPPLAIHPLFCDVFA